MSGSQELLRRAVARYETGLGKHAASQVPAILKNMGRGLAAGLAEGAAFGWGIHQPPKQLIQTSIATGIGGMFAAPSAIALARALREKETTQSLRRIVRMSPDLLERVRNVHLRLRRGN